jgi:hypothetical protein
LHAIIVFTDNNQACFLHINNWKLEAPLEPPHLTTPERKRQFTARFGGVRWLKWNSKFNCGLRYRFVIE